MCVCVKHIISNIYKLEFVHWTSIIFIDMTICQLRNCAFSSFPCNNNIPSN